jgi:hypothetical protein
VAGLDGTIALGPKYQIEFQLVGSRTREPNDPSLTTGVDALLFDKGRHTARFDGEQFDGYAQYTSFERSARTWNFDFDYYASSPTFRAENGFETRNNSRRVSMFQSLNFYPEGVVERISPQLSVQRSWNFEGVRKSQSAELSLDAQLKGQLEVDLEVRTADERFRDVYFEGLNQIAFGIETAFSRIFQGGIEIGHGDQLARNVAVPEVGKGTDIEAFATIRPTGWIALRPSYVHSDLSVGGQEIFSGYILRNRADLQFTRELFLRLVVEYDNFDKALSIEPLLTYRVNPFTLVYAGSARGYQQYEGPTGWTRTDTQYFAKVQYLLRR